MEAIEDDPSGAPMCIRRSLITVVKYKIRLRCRHERTEREPAVRVLDEVMTIRKNMEVEMSLRKKKLKRQRQEDTILANPPKRMKKQIVSISFNAYSCHISYHTFRLHV